MNHRLSLTAHNCVPSPASLAVRHHQFGSPLTCAVYLKPRNILSARSGLLQNLTCQSQLKEVKHQKRRFKNLLSSTDSFML